MTQELLARNVLAILKGICWHDDYRATWDPDNGRLRIRFEPNPGDFGYCMGEGGHVIKGLQFIASEIGRLNGYAVNVKLAQNWDGNAEKEEHTFEQNVAFDSSEIERVSTGLVASAFGRELHSKAIRKNDLIEINFEVRNESEKRIVDALNEPLYAYGFRQGCIIKLSTLNAEKVA